MGVVTLNMYDCKETGLIITDQIRITGYRLCSTIHMLLFFPLNVVG